MKFGLQYVYAPLRFQDQGNMNGTFTINSDLDFDPNNPRTFPERLSIRVPGSIDYNGFLRATRFVTKDEREVVKAYRRAVFNVVMHNRDDHAKNFAWRLGADSRWRVAPAYDLTFNEGPSGEHSLDVGGKGTAITRADLNALAIDAGVRVATANQVIDEVAEAAGTLAQRALSWPIRAQTVTSLVRSVESCRKLMGS